MVLLHWLGGRRQGVGRIYSGQGVSPAHARTAEEAISGNRYTVYASTPDRSRAILVLRTLPPLVAKVSRDASFSGLTTDLTINAVYDPDGEIEALVGKLGLD